MARTRYRRKDLKRPDEFVSTGRQVLLWAGENSRRLYQALGVLAVVLVAIGAVYSLRGARARQANDDLGGALALLRAGKYGDAAAQLTEVANRWQSTGPGEVARLYAASASVKAGNYDGAATLAQAIVQGGGLAPYLRQQGLVTLAFALEQKGDTAGAATRYDEAAGVEGPFTPEAILGAARCRERLGETAAARDLYQRYVREFPTASDVSRATAKAEALST